MCNIYNVYLRGSTLFDASEADIRKGNTSQHLVETVCHPIAIPFPYGLVEQIGGEYRKQSVIIPVFQQLYDGGIDIAILLHLHWFQSEIVNSQQSCALQLIELVFIVREVQNLYGFIDSQTCIRRMSVIIRILWICSLHEIKVLIVASAVDLPLPGLPAISNPTVLFGFSNHIATSVRHFLSAGFSMYVLP